MTDLKDFLPQVFLGAAESWEPADFPLYDVNAGTESAFLRGQLEVISNSFYHELLTDQEKADDWAEFSDVMKRAYDGVRAALYAQHGLTDPLIKQEFNPDAITAKFAEDLFLALQEGRLDDALDYAKATVGFKE